MSKQSDIWKALDGGSERTVFDQQSESVTYLDKTELARKISDLRDTAYNYYKLEQLDTALALYQRAYRLAVQVGDEESQVEFKCWEGHCLRDMDRLTEALASLIELEKCTQNPRERWAGLIDQIQIAVEIPISLQKIQTIIDRCYHEMRQYGLKKSKSMILSHECVLLLAQGKDALALKKAQEAMASYKDDAYPVYSKNTHYLALIWAYLDVGDRENAERWLGRYEASDTDFPIFKESNTLSIKRKLALLDQNYRTAWDYAVRNLLKDREFDAHPYFALKSIVDCGIAAGRPKDVRNYLAELLSAHRNSENGHNRYKIRRAVGDFHRAMADLPETIPEQASRHRKLARRYYGYAMKVGKMIDARLCCSWRQEQIRERLKSVE